MSEEKAPFSKWALEDARTLDERYLILQLCETCRLLENLRMPLEWRKTHIFKSFPHQKWQEFYLNPLLKPDYGPEDTARAEAMSRHLKKFAPKGNGYHSRYFGDVGHVLRYFPALEDLSLGTSNMADLSFLEALPDLRSLQLNSGVLENLEPFRHASSLQHLRLCLSSAGPPNFTPPLYWVKDASPLSALVNLKHLTFSPNPAMLAGLTFPSLITATFINEHCIQPDCAHLPDMPKLRVLNLGGVQSLRGIGRFPELRHLTINGPLRDYADIEKLQHLDCLEVNTQEGWPRDVTPLNQLPNLLWVSFGGEIPRNYWPLAQAPRLCQLEVPGVPSIHLDVQAVNAVLSSWDDVFALPQPRPLPPLRFVAVEIGGDISILPKHSEAPDETFLAHPKLFHLELQWMDRKATQAIKQLFEDEDAVERSSHNCQPSHWERTLSYEVHTMEAVARFPEILDALRGAMASSPHDWCFNVWVRLRLKEREMTEQQKKWLKQIEERSDREEEESSFEIYKKTKSHVIETQFRKRVTEEEGEKPDAEDFEPPDEIRPQYYHRVPVPAPGGGSDDEGDDEEDNPDFQLKPFDEQEKNDPNDSDEGDGDVKTAPPPDPPPSFFDDPYAHPLADSYMFFATLTMDSFYHHGRNLATVMQLMRRQPDEVHPAPPEE